MLLIYDHSKTKTGFGDMIQFARFVPHLASKGASVVIEARQELIDLFRTLRGLNAAIAVDADPPPFDVTCPILLLPSRCGSTSTNLPGTPYLSAPKSYLEKWSARIPQDGRLRVGLVWSGDPKANKVESYSARWCDFADIAPLLGIEGVQFFSIRKGMPRDQIEKMSGDPRIVHVGDEFENFADTAAVIELMDIIITIDGSVAHLAGAMGKPVWVLLDSPIAFWMWGEFEGSTTPWYSSARLFRQSTPREWAPVVATVAAELKNLVQQ